MPELRPQPLRHRPRRREAMQRWGRPGRRRTLPPSASSPGAPRRRRGRTTPTATPAPAHARPHWAPGRRGGVPPAATTTSCGRRRPRSHRRGVDPARRQRRPPAPRRRLLTWSGVEAATVPRLDDVCRRARAASLARARGRWVPLLASRTTTRAGAVASKRRRIAGMGMTEKQGGSDVRANATTADPGAGRPVEGGEPTGSPATSGSPPPR